MCRRSGANVRKAAGNTGRTQTRNGQDGEPPPALLRDCPRKRPVGTSGSHRAARPDFTNQGWCALTPCAAPSNTWQLHCGSLFWSNLPVISEQDTNTRATRPIVEPALSRILYVKKRRDPPLHLRLQAKHPVITKASKPGPLSAGPLDCCAQQRQTPDA